MKGLYPSYSASFSTPLATSSAHSVEHFGQTGSFHHAPNSSAAFSPQLPDYYNAGSMVPLRDSSTMNISSPHRMPSTNQQLSAFVSPRHSFSSHGGYSDASARNRSYKVSSLPTGPHLTNLPPILQSQPLHSTTGSNQILSQPQLRQAKRLRSELDVTQSGPHPHRKRSTSTIAPAQLEPVEESPVELSEEEQLLFKLKQEDNLPWKDIAKEFEAHFGRAYQVPALQMRYKRLRERLRAWTDDDVRTDRLSVTYNVLNFLRLKHWKQHMITGRSQNSKLFLRRYIASDLIAINTWTKLTEYR